LTANRSFRTILFDRIADVPEIEQVIAAELLPRGLVMKTKSVLCAACALSVLVSLSNIAALAQPQGHDRRQVHFTGLLNDYSPTNPMISGSPYEMHGRWSLDIHESGTADFLAEMTMSDYGTTSGALDPLKGGQNSHTHHIRLTNIKITWNIIGCPAFATPAPTGGFQISGTVSLITGNGNVAPFETTPPTSTLQVCILGGNELPYSNLAMVFGGPAAIKHFGSQAIHGVVDKPVLDGVAKDK
jgi:hypothetical protein